MDCTPPLGQGHAGHPFPWAVLPGPPRFNCLPRRLLRHADPDNRLAENEPREWNDLNIIDDIGIHKSSVNSFTKLLTVTNGERPAPQRFGNNEIGDRILEAIIDSSAHFSEGAIEEYNALPGNRQFEYPAAHPLAGQRNYIELTKHYNMLWELAFEKGHGLTPMAP